MANQIRISGIKQMIVCFIVIFLFSNRLHSEETLHESYFHAKKSELYNDVYLTYQNSIDLVSAPVHAKTRDWIIAASVVGVTAASFALDSKVHALALAHQSKRNDKIFWFGHVYGSGFTAAGVGAGLYATGLIFSEDWTRETGREILTAVALAGLTTGILKSGFGRSRPFVNNKPFIFRPFEFSNNYYSFPSGHATTAFAISTVLASRIGNPYASAGLYSLAFLTAAQRMYSSNHWLSDCIMAASIGTVVGRFISKDSDKIIMRKNISISLTPVAGFSNTGLALDLNF